MKPPKKSRRGRASFGATGHGAREESADKTDDEPAVKEVAVDEDAADEDDTKELPLEQQAISKEIAEDKGTPTNQQSCRQGSSPWSDNKPVKAAAIQPTRMPPKTEHSRRPTDEEAAEYEAKPQTDGVFDQPRMRSSFSWRNT